MFYIIVMFWMFMIGMFSCEIVVIILKVIFIKMVDNFVWKFKCRDNMLK